MYQNAAFMSTMSSVWFSRPVRLYWLAFLTWGICILHERRFTMKTGGLFVLFTLVNIQ